LIELIGGSSQKGASASKAQRASELLRAGKTQEALPVLEELKNAKRSENTPEANRFATVLEHQIATLESELEQLKIAEQKALLFDPQLELLQKVVPQLSRVSEVEGTVKQFSREFEAGARDPDRFLSEIRSSQRE